MHLSYYILANIFHKCAHTRSRLSTYKIQLIYVFGFFPLRSSSRIYTHLPLQHLSHFHLMHPTQDMPIKSTINRPQGGSVSNSKDKCISFE